jgi:hypothetical protein
MITNKEDNNKPARLLRGINNNNAIINSRDIIIQAKKEVCTV